MSRASRLFCPGSVAGYSNSVIGDMTIIGTPSRELRSALETVATQLHPTFDRFFPAQRSKSNCIACSWVLRDFLRRTGLVDAREAPVSVALRANKDGQKLDRQPIGEPSLDEVVIDAGARRWTGHMVVIVDGFLIDLTLYPYLRESWPDLTGMIALPLACVCWPVSWRQRGQLADAFVMRCDYFFEALWVDASEKTAWRQHFNPEALAQVTAALVGQYDRRLYQERNDLVSSCGLE